MASPSPVSLVNTNKQHRCNAKCILKVSVAEVVVVITGSGLAEEQGCGVCVQRLTETLRELRMVIQNSSSLLPSVNSTQEDLLGDGIMESQVSGTSKEFSDRMLGPTVDPR